MQHELEKIWEQARKTVLSVIHDIEEAIFLADRVVVLTSRPERIKTIIEVTLPRPRAPAVKLTEAFVELKRRAWEELGFIVA